MISCFTGVGKCGDTGPKSLSHPFKRRDSIVIRQKCVDLHKAGNGYKKISAGLKMPI